MKEYATLKLTLTVDTGGYHCTESHRVTIRQWTDVLKALAPTQTGEENPIPMILHCPVCGLQHVDAPDTHDEAADKMLSSPRVEPWNNPPHRSHLCRPEHGGCGHIWRPADVPTEGVAAITTWGKNDSPPTTRTGEENAGLVEALEQAEGWFLDYAHQHDAKGTAEARAKADVNRDRANALRAAINDAPASRSPIPGEALQNQLTRNPGELAATNPLSLGKGIKMSGHTVDEATDTSSPPSGRPERVRCIDAWDSFNNLVVGKVYDVAKTTEGGSMVWVIGERGFCGGWSKWRFEAAQ